MDCMKDNEKRMYQRTGELIVENNKRLLRFQEITDFRVEEAVRQAIYPAPRSELHSILGENMYGLMVEFSLMHPGVCRTHETRFPEIPEITDKFELFTDDEANFLSLWQEHLRCHLEVIKSL